MASWILNFLLWADILLLLKDNFSYYNDMPVYDTIYTTTQVHCDILNFNIVL